MTDIHETAEFFRRLERNLAEQLKVVPKAPDVRPAADELGPIPAIRPAVEAVAIGVALLAYYFA